MNLKVVGKYLGYLLFTEGAFLFIPFLVGVMYREWQLLPAFAITIAICFLLGGILYLLCRSESQAIYVRESFGVAGLGWILLSAIGALPFVISGEIPHFIDAFFETVSGFTTTGASILVNVEALSHATLFWRSFTHWLGGMGILVFILALVNNRSKAGSTLQLLRAESPGPQVDKIVPKTKDSAKVLYLIYITLSLSNLLFLVLGRMPIFDAFCTMFGTAGTGGFGIKLDSMASYSPYLQNITTIFMTLFGVNFSLYYLLLRRSWKTVLKDEELRLYLGIMLASIAIISVSLWINHFGTLGENIHHAAFTVSSIMTTTGYATADFDLWPQITRSLILILMIFGAMAGSTGGGLKMSRLLILLKSIKASMHRLTHPRSVKTIKINGKTLDSEVLRGVHLSLSVYCIIAIITFVLISIDGLSLGTNLSAMMSCLNNIGPGLEQVGPTMSYAPYSHFSKIVLSLAMLLGRLDIFPILFLFMPSSWRKQA